MRNTPSRRSQPEKRFPLTPFIGTIGAGTKIFPAYPSEAVAEIVEVLEWIEANPDGLWDDMKELRAKYERWRDIIRGAPALLDDLGTYRTVPGLSSFGRIFLLEHAT